MTKVFICKCSSLEHQFSLSTDDEYAYIGVHLAPLPFFQRLKLAVKYIFGYRCRYGSFDEILLDPIMALSLGDYLISWAQGDDPGFRTNDVY